MVTCYRGNDRDFRYDCTCHQINYGAPHCQALAGGALDTFVTTLILQALRSSAIEVSLRSAEDVELERAQHHRQWALRLEQARYEVERTARQYNAVEPENRLVARTLEQRWEHARFVACAPARLTPAEQAPIRDLAADVPDLWHAPTTTAAERKEIARLLLDRVEVTVIDNSEHAELVCSWIGGRQTRHRLVRSVRRTTQLSRHAELLDRIRALLAEDLHAAAIARILAAEGWSSTHGKSFTEGSVRALLTRMGHISTSPERPSAVVERQADKSTVAEIAAHLNIPEGTIYSGVYKHRLPVRRVKAAWHTLYLLHLGDVEQLLRGRTQGGRLPARPAGSTIRPDIKQERMT